MSGEVRFEGPLRYSTWLPRRAHIHVLSFDTFADTEAGCGSGVEAESSAGRDVELPAKLVTFCLRQPLSWRSSSSSHRSPKSVNVATCAETRLVVTSSDSNRSRRVCGSPIFHWSASLSKSIFFSGRRLTTRVTFASFSNHTRLDRCSAEAI